MQPNTTFNVVWTLCERWQITTVRMLRLTNKTKTHFHLNIVSFNYQNPVVEVTHYRVKCSKDSPWTWRRRLFTCCLWRGV